MPASEELIMAVAATAELCGKPFSQAAAMMLVHDLEGFDERAVLAALTRCRKELTGAQFNVAAIIARIDDGRPGPQEAWSMIPMDESQSVVWTQEMIDAWAVAEKQLDGKGNIQARMAFLEVYTKRVTEARDQRVKPVWRVSAGTDKAQLETVLATAVQKGRIALAHAKTIMPLLDAPPAADPALLLQGLSVRRIEQ